MSAWRRLWVLVAVVLWLIGGLAPAGSEAPGDVVSRGDALRVLPFRRFDWVEAAQTPRYASDDQGTDDAPPSPTFRLIVRAPVAAPLAAASHSSATRAPLAGRPRGPPHVRLT